MMLVLATLACQTPKPAEVPPRTEVVVKIASAQVVLHPLVGEPVKLGTVDEWLASALDGPAEDLVDQLKGTSVPVIIEAPRGTMWALPQRAWVSATDAGLSDIRFRLAGETALPASRPPTGRWIGSCPDGPIPVVGIDTRLTLDLQHDSDGTWMRATAGFRPRVTRGADVVAVDGLPIECWGALSCDIDGVDPEQCRATTRDAPSRVALADSTGCWMPIAKTTPKLAEWPTLIAERLGTIGVDDSFDVGLIVEPRVPFEAVVNTLAAFANSGRAIPALTRAVVQGNNGPPLCTATVKDADALLAARSAWLGSRPRSE